MKPKARTLLAYSGPFFSLAVLIGTIVLLSSLGVLVQEPRGAKITEMRYESTVEFGSWWNLTIVARNYDMGFVGASFEIELFFTDFRCEHAERLWIFRGGEGTFGPITFKAGRCFGVGDNRLQIQLYSVQYGERTLRDVERIGVHVIGQVTNPSFVGNLTMCTRFQS